MHSTTTYTATTRTLLVFLGSVNKLGLYTIAKAGIPCTCDTVCSACKNTSNYGNRLIKHSSHIFQWNLFILRKLFIILSGVTFSTVIIYKYVSWHSSLIDKFYDSSYKGLTVGEKGDIKANLRSSMLQ